MSKNLNKNYMQVARACLQILNNVNPAADRTQQIDELYQAIDTAVGDLYKQQEQSIGRCYTTLRAISELDPEQADLQQAIKLASDALPASH